MPQRPYAIEIEQVDERLAEYPRAIVSVESTLRRQESWYGVGRSSER
jgi:hypothetical protein